jgi:hypothetical protein
MSSPASPASPASSSSPSPNSDHIPYIISPIMPTEEVHLIGGPSGAGKTTFLFQMIEDWAQSQPVLGYESHPRPFLYIPCDRSEASTARTIERIGCKVPIPVFSLVDHNVPCTIDNISKVSREQLKVKSDAQIVLFIDAFGTLVPGGKINDYATVGSWLREVNRKCKREHMTIIGLGHSTKTKEGETFNNPRQRFLGSVAWGGFVDTMIFIEPENAEDPTDTSRRIFVLPRNSAELSMRYHFSSNGRLVSSDDECDSFILESKLKTIPAGSEVESSTLQEWGEASGLSRRSVFNWIKQAISDGKLSKVRHGVYSVKGTN